MSMCMVLKCVKIYIFLVDGFFDSQCYTCVFCYTRKEYNWIQLGMNDSKESFNYEGLILFQGTV